MMVFVEGHVETGEKTCEMISHGRREELCYRWESRAQLVGLALHDLNFKELRDKMML
jgi:hypothetical protein